MTKKRGVIYLLMVIAVTLLSIRAILPIAVQSFVTKKLNQSPNFSSYIGDVDLSLFRGAYKVQDIAITKIEGDLPVPLFAASSIELSVLWAALLKGEVVSEIDFYEPVINIVDSENPENQQTGEDVKWLTILDELVLLRIDRATLHDAEIHFRNFDVNPPMDAFLGQVNGSVFNLTNSDDLDRVLTASMDFDGKIMSTGTFSAQVELDPTSQRPSFTIDAKILGLALLDIDSLIATYAPFDIEGGNLDLVLELTAVNGKLDGYFKPLVHDLEIFEWHEDIVEDGDNPFQALWEALIGLTSELFQNQAEDQFATLIPIEGNIDNLEVGLLATVGNVLENAFIRAYQARFSNEESVDGVDDADAVSSK